MLRNYFLVAIRHLMRNKMTSLIHVTGFGLGIAAFLFAAQTVIVEYSFDKFHAGKNNICNVGVTFVNQNGEPSHFLSATPGLYHLIKAQLPEVALVTRCMYQRNREPYCVLAYTAPDGELKSFNELNVQYVDDGRWVYHPVYALKNE
jgi:putative ABC transport system permease protein